MDIKLIPSSAGSPLTWEWCSWECRGCRGCRRWRHTRSRRRRFWVSPAGPCISASRTPRLASFCVYKTDITPWLVRRCQWMTECEQLQSNFSSNECEMRSFEKFRSTICLILIQLNRSMFSKSCNAVHVKVYKWYFDEINVRRHTEKIMLHSEKSSKFPSIIFLNSLLVLLGDALKNELLPKYCDHKARMSKRKTKSSSPWEIFLQESSELELGSGWLSSIKWRTTVKT